MKEANFMSRVCVYSSTLSVYVHAVFRSDLLYPTLASFSGLAYSIDEFWNIRQTITTWTKSLPTVRMPGNPNTNACMRVLRG